MRSRDPSAIPPAYARPSAHSDAHEGTAMNANTMIRRTLLACGLLQAGVAAADGALDTNWGFAGTG